MSFTSFAAEPLLTREQIAQQVHQVSLARGLDVFATVLTCMAIEIEVGADPHGKGYNEWWCPANPTNWAPSMQFPHDSTSNDGRSSGYLQQQPGPNGEPWWGTTENMMTLAQAVNTFQDRLSDNYEQAVNDPQLAGQFIQQVQGSAFPDRYQAAWNVSHDVVNRALAQPTPAPAPTPTPAPGGNVPTSIANQNDPRLAVLAQIRPDFNEYPVWASRNFEPRNGTPVDLHLRHTEENSGYDDADGLAHWLETTTNTGNPVSYHGTISKGQNDDGVTVCYVVDTDQAAWAVGNSNLRSINYCYAGSSVNWTRQEWIDNLGRCIDVLAYITVQDAIKYGFDPIVCPGPQYGINPPVVSDHRYCTDWLKDGNTHVDVGDNYPWDLDLAAVRKYWNYANSTPTPAPGPTPPTPPAPGPAPEPTDGDYEVLAQIRGRWGRLGKNPEGQDRTFIEALGVLVDKAEGTDNSANTDFGW